MRKVKINKTHSIIISTIGIVASFTLKQLIGYAVPAIVVMLLTTLLAGAPVFKKAFSALRYKIVGIDALVTIAVVGAVIIGEYWEAAAVSYLFMLGDYLEARTIEKTRSSIKALLDSAPVSARVIRDDEEIIIPPDQVRPGDTVLVKTGEKLPVDGTVTQGYGSINQAAITGESLPVEAVSGKQVYSGTVVESGYVFIHTQKVGEDTAFAGILQLVEEAQDKKARTQKYLETFSRFYTPVIIIMALTLFIITRNIELALTLLVIACPGALVISAPVSVVAGIGNGARNGVLVKGGEIIERLGRIKVLAFDKTGTLTEGKPRVTGVFPLGNTTGEELMEITAAGEAYSEHPLAGAVIEHAKKHFGLSGLLSDLPNTENTRLLPGQGLMFFLEGTEYFIGNRGLFSSYNIAVTPEAETILSGQEDKGQTAVLIGSRSRLLGVIAIADVLRPGAKRLIARLKGMGIEHIAMLTGDNRRAAASLSGKLGLDDVYSELLPADKARILVELQQSHGLTAMVGDGVNDAPALASADLGIAIGGVGSDIAMETADVVLMSSRLEKLGYAISLSRATLNNMNQNITFALLVAGMLLAGVLVQTVNLSFGMLVHEISVLLVIINAARLLRFRQKNRRKNRTQYRRRNESA